MATFTSLGASGMTAESLGSIIGSYLKYQRAQETRRRLTTNVPLPALLGWAVARMTGVLALHTLVLTAAALAALVIGAWTREMWARIRLTRVLTSDVADLAGIPMP